MTNKVFPVSAPFPKAMLAWDGTDWRVVLVDEDHHIQADILSSDLPTGAATEDSLEACETALEIIDGFADPENTIFGFKEAIHTVKSGALGDGAITLTGDTVGANELWVITSICVYNNSGAMANAQITVVTDATEYILQRTVTAYAQWESYNWTGELHLSTGYKLTAYVGATTGDTIYFIYHGYKMKV